MSWPIHPVVTKLLEMVIMTVAGLWQGVRQDFNLLELAILAAAWWWWRRRRSQNAESARPDWPWTIPAWTRQHPAAAACLLAALLILARLALLPWLGAPFPRITDEYSHLLLADTLLQGRLANPPHPFWEHFESLHIIQQPHYSSNYFPAHAAWLAAGRLLLGSAWAGVLGQYLAFLLALYWMLRGWRMPARWALFGVLLAGLRLGIGSYWINAFHGGFFAALGGALLLGAYPRLTGGSGRRRIRWADAAALGAGLAVLMSSRPFEGFFCSAPVVLHLAWIHRARFGHLARISAAVLMIVGLSAAGLGIYFQAVTGSPRVTTYQVSQKTYGWPMALAWTTPPRIEHRHKELADYYQYEVEEHEKVESIPNLIEYLTFRMQEYWRFFVGPLLTVPLILALRRARRRRMMALLSLGGALSAILLEGASSPHYLAPATGAILLLLVDGCRRLHRVALAFPAAMAGILLLRIGAEAAGLPYTQALNFQSWCCRVDANGNKSKITARLEKAATAPHLVFVRTKQDKYNLEQWIYNAADIDASAIVWARDLGEEKNAALRRYYAARTAWILDPNVDPPVLAPYKGEATEAAVTPASVPNPCGTPGGRTCSPPRYW